MGIAASDVEPLSLHSGHGSDVPLLGGGSDVETGEKNELAKVQKRSLGMSICMLVLSIPALIGG